MRRKMLYGISILFLLVIGASLWLYFGSIPEKLPIRAKQVFIGMTGRA